MEKAANTPPISNSNSSPFNPGATVIYGIHGKCSLIGIERRLVNNQEIQFYKLEIQKSNLSRSTRKEPAIWIPVASAQERGLRHPCTPEEATEVLAILSSREYYFSLQEPWQSIHPKLENCIRSEGPLGLAKAMSFAFVYKRRTPAPAAEFLNFYDTVKKLLLRELCDTLEKPLREIEDQVARSMRQKLHLDQ